MRSRIGRAPDEGPHLSRLPSVNTQTFTHTHSAIQSVGTLSVVTLEAAVILNRRESWPRIADAARAAIVIAMTFKCLDCNLPIEGDPWWYDPLSHGINAGPPATLTGVVSQRPAPPTPASAPFHKVCLERQLGRSVNS